VLRPLFFSETTCSSSTRGPDLPSPKHVAFGEARSWTPLGLLNRGSSTRCESSATQVAGFDGSTQTTWWGAGAGGGVGSAAGDAETGRAVRQTDNADRTAIRRRWIRVLMLSDGPRRKGQGN